MKWLACAVALLTLGLLPALAAAQPTPTPVVTIKWPGPLVIGDTPCGEAYVSIHKTASGRQFMWHVEGCQPLENLVSGNNPPLPTPKPTATPVGTVIPGDPLLCPDGFLTEPASKTDPWYGFTVDIPEGVTKRFCAPVEPPYATPQLTSPLGNYFTQITFSWYDVSDQDCGALNVHVDAVDGVSRPRGGPGFSASGNHVYYGKIGTRITTPEQTLPGIYVMTLVGGPTTCHRYRISWKATP
ncbi:MAG: hypothetical protein AB1689_03560 [Thermodesulfobacteriota bacterium]